MPSGFNHNERVSELFFGVTPEHIFQFCVNGVHRLRGNAEINDAASSGFHKNQAAEVPVARDEDSMILRCPGEQVPVTGLRHAEGASRDNLVSQRLKAPFRDRVNILVEEKPHDAET
jgi:hypothetical protein